jgi:hypothetical protein
MVDIAKATKTLEYYFAGVTKEQFSDDLRKFCPELFEEEEDQTNGSEDSSLSEANDRQLDLLTYSEIYRKAKEDNKIEIATKLLHKGISVKEVADLLELDINSLAQPL